MPPASADSRKHKKSNVFPKTQNKLTTRYHNAPVAVPHDIIVGGMVAQSTGQC